MMEMMWAEIPAWLSVGDYLPADPGVVLALYLVPERAGKRGRPAHWSVCPVRYSGGQWRFITPKHRERKPERVKFWAPRPALPPLPV